MSPFSTGRATTALPSRSRAFLAAPRAAPMPMASSFLARPALPTCRTAISRRPQPACPARRASTTRLASRPAPPTATPSALSMSATTMSVWSATAPTVQSRPTLTPASPRSANRAWASHLSALARPVTARRSSVRRRRPSSASTASLTTFVPSRVWTELATATTRPCSTSPASTAAPRATRQSPARTHISTFLTAAAPTSVALTTSPSPCSLPRTSPST
mmetsp:Transcript_29007/g.63489  ORF Transcript_29007/g.63489 Transcript_29007/m.63489 type:complete len:219 (+) Transcript_29007:901-1557(+)